MFTASHLSDHVHDHMTFQKTPSKHIGGSRSRPKVHRCMQGKAVRGPKAPRTTTTRQQDKNTLLKFYTSFMTHSSSSSRWQPSSDWKSTWSCDSWVTSSWIEQVFLLPVKRCHFACRMFHLLAIGGECGTVHQPRTTFSHAQLLRSLVAVLLSRCTDTR